MPGATLPERIKARARELGFSAVGIAEPGPAVTHGFYEDWLAAGHSGAMSYLVRHSPLKRDPHELLKTVKSLVLVALPYGGAAILPSAGLRGRIARYAWGRDYHDVIGEKLNRLAESIAAEAGRPVVWRSFVDTAPLLEREWAVRAGIGWVGKNANLIHPEQGSWLFLSGLALDLALAPDHPEFSANAPRDVELARLLEQDGCGSCRACIDACPTQAIVADRTVDARRCISYLTIELKGHIPKDLRPEMGEWVFGCDLCQDVCPWNRASAPAPDFELESSPQQASPDLMGLLELDEATFLRRFGSSALRRTRRRGLVRNAAIAVGNALSLDEPEAARLTAQERQAAVEKLVRLLGDPEPVVRGAAAWALGRGKALASADALSAALNQESDPATRADMRDALAELNAVRSTIDP